MKKMILLLSIVFMCFVTLQAQVNVGPYGVSPRDAESDTTDIFDLPYNALLNVGTGTQMYLMAEAGVDLSGTQTWTIDLQPTGSTSVIGVKQAMGTKGEAIVFVPDEVGKYIITFTDDTLTASVTINAAKYLGNEGGTVGCVQCHASKAAEWKTTGHSDALIRGLNGLKGDHFAGYCVSCHSTGYDSNASNDGFDDFTFVFPDTLYVGMADTIKAAYPDAMARANIQCEACHGPGSGHFGNKAENKMVSSFDSKTCAVCHDAGTHHVYPAQYDVSGHAAGLYVGYAGNRAGCSSCHSGTGFVAALRGETEVPPATQITCATCHDPHNNADGNHQLRTTADVELGNGEMVTDGGYGKLCMNCHKSRRNAKEYTGENFKYSSHYGPHHGPQADMLMGKNVPDFGVKLPSSPHGQAVENACVGCHMKAAHVDENNQVVLAGGHSFSVTFPDGTDNVAVCEECHGDIGETFAEKKFYFNGMADHDGDGVEEGLQEEVEGLLEELALMLPPYDTATVDMSGKVYKTTVTEAKAAYNYIFVEEDRSKGVHNPAFAVNLLKVSIAALMFDAEGPGKILGVMDVPNDQGKQVNVAFTRFGNDSPLPMNKVDSYGVWRVEPLPPAANKYLDKENISSSGLNIGDKVRDENFILTYVAAVPAAMLPGYNVVVPTLFNTVGTDTAWTPFVVSAFGKDGMVDWTEPMAGFSVDNLIPAPPAGFAGAIIEGGIELSWAESMDEDFQYFAVYKSETQNFDPTSMQPITTTTNLNYVDGDVESGKTYYYKVSATDFNSNQSDFTIELGFTITGIAENEAIPTKFDLYQNYPNPFNPTTQIKFALPEASNVKVTIYNSIGKQVAVISNNNYAAGYHTINWNASNNSSGVYFCELKANDRVFINKMLLIK